MKREKQLQRQRLMAIFCGGLLLFNYPLLSVFSQNGAIDGVPILYIYILIAWGAFIGLLIILVERK